MEDPNESANEEKEAADADISFFRTEAAGDPKRTSVAASCAPRASAIAVAASAAAARATLSESHSAKTDEAQVRPSAEGGSTGSTAARSRKQRRTTRGELVPSGAATKEARSPTQSAEARREASGCGWRGAPCVTAALSSGEAPLRRRSLLLPCRAPPRVRSAVRSARAARTAAAASAASLAASVCASEKSCTHGMAAQACSAESSE